MSPTPKKNGNNKAERNSIILTSPGSTNTHANKHTHSYRNHIKEITKHIQNSHTSSKADIDVSQYRFIKKKKQMVSCHHHHY